MVALTFDALKGLQTNIPLFVQKTINDESDGSCTDNTPEAEPSKTE